MILKGIIWEDYTNYKLPVMQLIFPKCSFKCGKGLCQNSPLATAPDTYFNEQEIIDKYIANPITKGVCCAGFEPFDSPQDLQNFANIFRKHTDDVFIVFTGYTEDELKDDLVYKTLKNLSNVIVKFGRYKPRQTSHYDPILGIKLASENQYARRIS